MIEEKEILIDNLKINYKIAGQGPAILILHGWGGSSDSWLKVQEILAKAGFKVICPDFPGFGKSKTPLERWGVGDYANFVNNFIKKTCGEPAEPFFLLGHSFGGRVAIKFSVLWPEKIKSLILCDSSGIKQKLGFREKLIFQISKLGNAIFTPTPLRRFKDKAKNLFYIFLRHRDYAKADGMMREILKKVIAEDLLDDLPQIKMRTLIIWGESDKLVPVKYAHIFKEKIKNSELKILPKIGHSPHLEIPEKLAKIIIQFLRS
jgi:pimeloyl-ACP methyl ester carboxylesterase